MDKAGRCSRCKRNTTVSRYTFLSQFGTKVNRWLCQMCAISRGFVLAYGGN